MGSISKAVALDIDGVILRGGGVIPGAKEAVARLIRAKIPFVFVSNGGGVLEELKAEQMSAKLGAHIRREQILLCHTPFSSLVRKYGSQHVLVVGQDSCLDVARSYGFRLLHRPSDFLHRNHHVLPTRGVATHTVGSLDPLPDIKAAMIFHDPTDWSLDMQVLSDVLAQPVPGHPSVQHVPLYASNLDLVYTNEYPLPRFTQGAFLEAFQHLFQLHHQVALQVTRFGKPFPIQYEFAERMLRLEAERLHETLSPQIAFFGVGDNPASDIQGANAAGAHWRSVLVRTGVFQSSAANDATFPAHHVCADVSAAVDFVLSAP